MKFIISAFLALIISLSANAKEASKPKEILLTADNTLALREDFNESSVSRLMEQAKKLNSSLPNGYPIYLFLYTPGGSIQDGLELFEYLKGINRPVHTITLFAASMGFQTVQQLGERYIVKYGVLMSHKARGGFQGEFGGGMSQLDSRYGLWLRRINMMDLDTVSRTGGKQTIESYRAQYQNELWLNGQEAVDQGYADAVVTVKCDSTLDAKTEDVEFKALFFSVKATMSGCPLQTAPISTTANISTNKGIMTVEEFISKGGIFGKECKSSETIVEGYRGDANTVIPAQLCAIDNTLDMVQIKKAIEDKIKFITRDLRGNVIYSY